MVLKRKLFGITLEEYWFDEKGFQKSDAHFSALKTYRKGLSKFCYIPEKTLILNLSETEQSLYNKIQKRQKNYLNKAKSHYEYLLSKNDQEIIACQNAYENFAKTRKLGTPDWKEEKELEFWVAKDKKGTISHCVAFLPIPQQGIYRYRYGVSLIRDHSNIGIFWNAILYAKKNNYKVFDFGGITDGNTNKGINQFKKNFGGEPLDTYLYLSTNIIGFSVALSIIARIAKNYSTRRRLTKLASILVK